MSQIDTIVSRNWKAFRDQMPVVKRWAYFDHAAVAPLPDPAQRALEIWSREAASEGDVVWNEWTQRVEGVRALAASQIGADSSEIALVPNTTAGIGLVAEGFPWKSGDNVVTLANEFPSNLYAWMNLQSQGVATRRVEMSGAAVDVDRIAAACDDRTRIVAISWVGYATGYRIDPAELAQVAHNHGALLLLDAIQGWGVFPLDVARAKVDFAVADGHKWLLGPEGAGLLYLRHEHLDLLRPTRVGWNSVTQRFDYDNIKLDFRPDAARYEGGSTNIAGFLALGMSLQLLDDFGLSNVNSPIAERILVLCDIACGRLEEVGAVIVSDREAKARSGIVSFELPGRDAASVRRVCLKHGVVLSCRAGCLRISPHAYNDEGDIEQLVDAVRLACMGGL